jgi:hypothetical protein
MADTFIGLGLDYREFVSGANAATGEVVKNAQASFTRLAQNASRLYGYGYGRPIAVGSRLAHGLAGPVFAPVQAIANAVTGTMAIARRSAALTGKAISKEFNLAAVLNRYIAPVKAAWDRTTAPFKVPIHKAWEKTFAGPTGLGTTPWGRLALAMKQFIPNFTAEWRSHQAAMRNGGGIFSNIGGLLGTLVAPLKAMSGIVMALGELVASVLGGAFRILGTIIRSVWSIAMTFLRGMWNLVTSLTKAVILLGTAIGAALAGGMMFAVERIKELNSLSRETGFAAADIYLLEKALFRTGLSAQSTANLMAKMRESMTFGVEPQLIQNLGLNLDALRKLPVTEQFAKLAETINRIENPIVRAKVATQLLGAEGAKAVANFQKGDMDLARKMFGGTTEAVAKTEAAVAMAHDNWNLLKNGVTAFFDRIVARLGPVLENLSKWFVDVLIPKAQEWADSIGNTLSNMIKTLVGLYSLGSLREALKLGFELVVRHLGNRLIQVFQFGVSFFQTLMRDKNLIEGLLHAFQGIKDILIWAFQSAAPVIAEIIGMAVGGAAAITGLKPGQDRQFREQKLFELTSAQKALEETTALLEEASKKHDWDNARRLRVKQVRLRMQVQEAADLALSPNAFAKYEAKRYGKIAGDFARNIVGKPDPQAFSKAAAEASAMATSFGKISLTLETILKLWEEAASTALTDADAEKKFVQLLKQALAEGERLLGGSEAGPKPGVGGNINFGQVFTRFDEYRRVGGGMAGAAQGSYTEIGQRQLSVQERMEGHLGKMAQYFIRTGKMTAKEGDLLYSGG